jgi:hypothetical protein
MTMEIQHTLGEAEFWSDFYEGRAVAILNRYGRWHVYLDHVLQHNVVFDTAENAVTWLTERIDQGMLARLN